MNPNYFGSGYWAIIFLFFKNCIIDKIFSFEELLSGLILTIESMPCKDCSSKTFKILDRFDEDVGLENKNVELLLKLFIDHRNSFYDKKIEYKDIFDFNNLT